MDWVINPPYAWTFLKSPLALTKIIQGLMGSGIALYIITLIHEDPSLSVVMLFLCNLTFVLMGLFTLFAGVFFKWDQCKIYSIEILCFFLATAFLFSSLMEAHFTRWGLIKEKESEKGESLKDLIEELYFRKHRDILIVSLVVYTFEVLIFFAKHAFYTPTIPISNWAYRRVLFNVNAGVVNTQEVSMNPSGDITRQNTRDSRRSRRSRKKTTTVRFDGSAAEVQTN